MCPQDEDLSTSYNGGPPIWPGDGDFIHLVMRGKVCDLRTRTFICFIIGNPLCDLRMSIYTATLYMGRAKGGGRGQQNEVLPRVSEILAPALCRCWMFDYLRPRRLWWVLPLWQPALKVMKGVAGFQSLPPMLSSHMPFLGTPSLYRREPSANRIRSEFSRGVSFTGRFAAFLLPYVLSRYGHPPLQGLLLSLGKSWQDWL